jgi:hypothetical protein
MAQKRAIDRLRESAGSMEIGSADDGPISLVGVGERLLIAMKTEVYEVKFADKVDPERTNPNIPNTKQKVLAIGVDSPLLGRTLLTAKVLFNKAYLPRELCDAAMARAFDAAADLTAMQASLDRLTAEQSDIERKLQGAKLTDGFEVPTIVDLDPLTKSFTQRADHVVHALFDIARLFYPDVTHADSLLRIAREQQLEAKTIEFLEATVPSMRFAREVRNAVEHPKPDKRVVIRGYALRPDGNLETPTIEVIHPTVPEPPIPVDVFMREMTEKLSIIFEVTLVHLCFHHSRFGEHRVAVMQVPEDRRPEPNVRFSYAIRIGDEWAPLG